MKTRSIARGIVGAVASLLGVVAVGCSAETGAPGDEAQIGSTSEALSVASGNSLSTAVKAPLTCVLNDGTDEYMIVAGGFTSPTGAGVPTTEIWALKNGTGSWFRIQDNAVSPANVNLSVARGQGKGMQVPGDASSCFLVGGSSSFDGAALAASGSQYVVEKLHVVHNGSHSGTAPAFSITHADNGTDYAQIALTRFELKACDSGNQIIAFGGINNSSAYQTGIVTFDTSSPTTAWNTRANMTNARADFGLAQEGANFVAAAGETTGGGGLADYDLLKSSSNCTSWTVSNKNNGNLSARRGLAALPTGTNTFAITAGRTASAIVGSTLDIAVTWSTMAVSETAPGTALADSVVTYRPSYVQLAKTTSTGFVLGGLKLVSGNFNTVTSKAVQKTEWTDDDLSETNGRVWGGVEYLPVAGKVIFTGGSKFTGSGVEAILASTDIITP